MPNGQSGSRVRQYFIGLSDPVRAVHRQAYAQIDFAQNFANALKMVNLTVRIRQYLTPDTHQTTKQASLSLLT
ncbi:hypothetical protein GCM10028816_34720 [Spirosoma lituiforme]